MSLEENKALVRRAYEVGFNHKDMRMRVIDEVFPQDYVVHYPGLAPIRGLEATKQALEAFFSAFPDMQFIVDDQLAEGDKVTTRWTGRGAHSGEYRGFPVAARVIPPSGRSVTLTPPTSTALSTARLWKSGTGWRPWSFCSRSAWLPYKASALLGMH